MFLPVRKVAQPVSKKNLKKHTNKENQGHTRKFVFQSMHAKKKENNSKKEKAPLKYGDKN